MFPFERLEVYNKSFVAHQMVHTYLSLNKDLPTYLRTQYGRASLSIMLNIAEGSGRSTDKDRRSFIVNARGSVFECVAILDFLNAQKEIPEKLYHDIKSIYDEISRMLFAMIRNLS